MRSLAARLAVALALVLLLGALAATFLPTSSDRGAECGNWIAPEWTQEGSAALVDDYAELAESEYADQGQLLGNASGIVEAYTSCSSKLDGRRLITFILLGSTVVVPALVVFVGGSRKGSDRRTSVA